VAKPSPPIPPTSTTLSTVLGTDAAPSDSGYDNGEEDTDDEPRGPGDPYSNLDGAFSNYLADEPQPITAGNHRGRHGDEDDLLF
jgi:AP-2 complex subunit beta-1